MSVAAEVFAEIQAMIAPPPDMNVAEWAEKYRYLSPESSASAGKYHVARIPYQKEPMEMAGVPGIHTVVLMWGAQTTKTTVLENILGRHIDLDPCPILMTQPSLKMASVFSKDRFDPLARDTPRVGEKVGKPTAKKKGSTIEHKQFAGGHFTMVGANAPSDLASRPIRVYLGDEIGRYPASAGKEGDPVALATERTTAFYNGYRYLTSSPGEKGFCPAEREYLRTDQRRYFVPCPFCGEYQTLEWANCRCDHDEDGHRLPSTAHFVCANESCHARIEENHKPRMLTLGEWRATAEAVDPGAIGFQLSQLYSPFVTWEKVHRKHQATKGYPELLKTFVNTVLAETWEVAGEKSDPESLWSRREEYEFEVPEGALVITSFTDVQGDRFETEFVGWGYGEESWSLAYVVTEADTANIEEYAEKLDPVLRRTFQGPRGAMVSMCSLIDAGYRTDTVYDFTRPRSSRMIFATHGKDGPSLAIVHSFAVPTRKRGARGQLKPKTVTIGVDTAKDLLASYLNVDEPGPGYCHFPMSYDHEYFEQLTAETRKTKFRHGRPVPYWDIPDGVRNEATDCRVGNMAAVRLLRVNWEKARPGAVRKPAAKKAGKRGRRRHTPRWQK